MKILTIETASLGNRGYVLISGDEAAVIDPQRDIDRVESLLDEHDLVLRHVFETHVHNDYVTGGLELARKRGASYVVSSADPLDYEHTNANDGDEFGVGNVVVRAMHTPGHTPDHLSYAVIENESATAVFSGGSMLFGSVGRTDLISDTASEALTRAQYQSVRRLAAEIPSEAGVYPTHGFGSFCSSSETSGSDESTIGEERKSNLALTLDDEDAFVEQLLNGLSAYPRYYVHMSPINRSGPDPVDLSAPQPVDPTEIRRRVHAGEWVVDLRSRTAFADGHLVGTINLEVGDSFATYLGWVMPWGTPVTLVGDGEAEVAEAQRQMARIGIDRPAGGAAGGIDEWAAGGPRKSYRRATFELLSNVVGSADLVVLDVRRDDEWAEGHISGAIHIPVPDLERRLAEIPDREVWVHCASGYRAALAASLLDRGGRRVVVIDDNWSSASEQSQLSIEKSKTP